MSSSDWRTRVSYFLTGLVASTATYALAFERRLHASGICTPVQSPRAVTAPYNFKLAEYGGTAFAGGIENQHPTQTVGVVCGIPSDDSLPHGSVRILNVHGQDGNAGVGNDFVAQACAARYNNPESFACGYPTPALAGTGRRDLGLDLYGWYGRPYDFPFVTVMIPPWGEGATYDYKKRSFVTGFYLTN